LNYVLNKWKHVQLDQLEMMENSSLSRIEL
jgi:hypothetical protein